MAGLLEAVVLGYGIGTPVAVVFLLLSQHLRLAGALLAPWGFLGALAIVTCRAPEAPFLAIVGALAAAAGIHFYVEGFKRDLVAEIAEAIEKAPTSTTKEE